MILRKVEVNQPTQICTGEIWKQFLKTTKDYFKKKQKQKQKQNKKKAINKNNKLEKFSGREWRYTSLCENYYSGLVGECSDITKL